MHDWWLNNIIGKEPAFENWKRVKHFGKMNLINVHTGKLLTDKWFNWIGYMIYGAAIVRSDEMKYNWIREDGTLVSEEWYGDVSEFGEDGKAFARTEDSYYTIYYDGEVNIEKTCPQDKRALDLI